jgi:hypothetical protein
MPPLANIHKALSVVFVTARDLVALHGVVNNFAKSSWAHSQFDEWRMVSPPCDTLYKFAA